MIPLGLYFFYKVREGNLSTVAKLFSKSVSRLFIVGHSAHAKAHFKALAEVQYLNASRVSGF